MKKPRFDEYVHELCHQEITDKIKKKYFRKSEERIHARLVAKTQSRDKVKKWIDRTSKRLYQNDTSPVPSDLGLFKAAN